MTVEELIAFRDKVVQAFLDKRILAPVHFPGGNEGQLIEIFKNVRPQDHVFSNWRSMYHALLKGIPQDWVFKEILAGRSMYLINKEHKLFSSSIVGGTLPIACGVAMGIKRANDEAIARGYCGDWGLLDERVFVFVGDMTAETGLFHEFCQFCRGHELPVSVVVEDNGFSTNTPTEEAWGKGTKQLSITRHSYRRTHPHVGLSEFVSF